MVVFVRRSGAKGGACPLGSLGAASPTIVERDVETKPAREIPRRPRVRSISIAESVAEGFRASSDDSAGLRAVGPDRGLLLLRERLLVAESLRMGPTNERDANKGL